jgi:hypothetical protein
MKYLSNRPSYFFLVLFLTFFSTNVSFAQQVAWLRGGDVHSQSTATKITTDASGNIYCVGSYSDSLTYESLTLRISDNDLPNKFAVIAYYIVKLDSNGKALWLKTIAWSEITPTVSYLMSFIGIQVDRQSNVYIAGTLNGFIHFPAKNTLSSKNTNYIAKFNENGEFVWSDETQDNFPYSSFLIDGEDNLIIGGNCYGGFTFENQISFSALVPATPPNLPVQSIYLAKISPDQKLIWVILGSTAVGRGGAYLGSGEYHCASIDYDNSVIMNCNFSSRGGYRIYTGDLTSYLTMRIDTFYFDEPPAESSLTKISLDGKIVWAKPNVTGFRGLSTKYGGPDYVYGNSIGIDNLGNSYLVGEEDGAVFLNDTLPLISESFLSKCDSDGNIQWVKPGDFGNLIAFDGVGDCYTFLKNILRKYDSNFNSLGVMDLALTETITGIAVNDNVWYACGQQGGDAAAFIVKIGEKKTGIVSNDYSRVYTLQAHLSSDPITANAEVIVKLQNAINVRMEIMDILGHVVFSEERMLSADENRMPINSTSLPSGIYIYRLQTGGEVVSVRFVKE